MSAKPSKKRAKKETAGSPLSASAPLQPASAAAAAPVASVPAETSTAWIDSPDPRKRTTGKFVLAGIWIYVAALWLLALDQTFHWGIFGPKIPPVP